MKAWNDCDGLKKGNVLEWDPGHWTIKGFIIQDFDDSIICSIHDDRQKIFMSDPVLTQVERGEFCSQMGGHRLIIDSNVMLERILNLFQKIFALPFLLCAV